MAEQRLSDFIRTHMEPILKEWDQFAKSIHAARKMDQVALRDEAQGMLNVIADDLDRSQTSRQQSEKSKGRGPVSKKASQAEKHGGARMMSGFSVTDASSEFRALRASVTRLWSEAQLAELRPAAKDLVRFNEAIDQAFTESLKYYTHEKERYTRLFDTILSSSPDLAAILDTDGKFIYANRAMAGLLKMSPSDIVGKDLSRLGFQSADQVQAAIQQVVNGKVDYRKEITSPLPDGSDAIYEYSFFPVINGDGNVEAVAAIARDITERKRSENVLSRGANFDQLTALPNRSFFLDNLKREVRRSARTGLPMALLFLDLDKFKEVNDRLGHDAGDELLLQAAQRISACVRDTDTVARLGGDEFTVILTEVKRNAHIESIARKILAELARPFSILGKEVHVSGSVGITLFPQDAATSEDLIRNADQAMYVSKEEGGNRYHYFTQAMQQAAQDRWQLLEDLRVALKKDQLRIYYQPIVELDTGRMFMAEALIRWEHPVRGMISPEEFIYLAEESGLMVEIGDWVFREAARQVKKIREQHDPDFHISVNQSVAQFRKDSTLYRTWLDYLDELGLAGDAIVIEIMESMMMDDSSLIREKLFEFRQAGIQVSLDDFGTGLSSVSYLKKFDINYVKIDQPFVRGLTTDPDAMAVCEAIIVMAHKLGLKVIAEGVETAEQKDCLQEVGCDYAQGYLFSKPLLAHEFDKLLNKGKKRHRQQGGGAHVALEPPSTNHMPIPAMKDVTAQKRRRSKPDNSRHNS